MFGSEEDARFILDWRRRRQDEGFSGEDALAPKEWERLGSGLYRTAFLSPGKVVYKVEHFPREHGDGNLSEAQNLRHYALVKLPSGCRLPRWNSFELDGRNVIAMEYFPKLLTGVRPLGPGRYYWLRREALCRSMSGLSDLHAANIAVDSDGDMLVPIDLGT